MVLIFAVIIVVLCLGQLELQFFILMVFLCVIYISYCHYSDFKPTAIIVTSCFFSAAVHSWCAVVFFMKLI